MLNITVTAANAARYCRTVDRAKGLLKEGYIFAPMDGDPTSFFAHTPTGNVYTVFTHIDFPTYRPKCSCPDFEKHGDFCKHLLCAAEILNDDAAKWDAICADHDENEGIADAAFEKACAKAGL